MEDKQTPLSEKKIFNLDEIELSIPMQITELDSGLFETSVPYLTSKEHQVKGLGPTLEESIEDYHNKYEQAQALSTHFFNEEHGGNERITRKEISINIHYKIYISPETYKRIQDVPELKSYFMAFEAKFPKTKWYLTKEPDTLSDTPPLPNK